MVVGKDSSFVVVKFNKIMKTTDFFENITNRAFFEDKIFPNEMEALNDRIWKMGDTCNVVDTFEFSKTDMVLNLNNVSFCRKESISFYLGNCRRRFLHYFLIVALTDNFCLLIEISQEDKNLSIDEFSYKYLINCDNNECVIKFE